MKRLRRVVITLKEFFLLLLLCSVLLSLHATLCLRQVTTTTTTRQRCRHQYQYHHHHNSVEEDSVHQITTIDAVGVPPLESFRQSTCIECSISTRSHEAQAASRMEQDAAAAARTKNVHIGVFHNGQTLMPRADDDQLSWQKQQQQIIQTIVAGLLTNGFHVTLYYMVVVSSSSSEMPAKTGSSANSDHNQQLQQLQQQQDGVTQEILQQIPCSLQSSAQQLLSIQLYTLEDSEQLACAQQPQQQHHQQQQQALHKNAMTAIRCNIQNALPWMEKFRQDIDRFKQVDFMLFDATFLPGLLLSELSLTPSLVLFSANDFLLQHILGITTAQYHSSSWMSQLRRELQTRMTSLQWTRSFMAWNRARQMLGLPRLRTLSDIWRGSLWTTTSSSSTGSSIGDGTNTWNVWHDKPQFLPYPQPLWPPCVVPCHPDGPQEVIAAQQQQQQQQKTSKTVVMPGGGNSNDAVLVVPALVISATTFQRRVQSRTLLQGLSLARSSLQQILLDCMKQQDDWEEGNTRDVINDDCSWKGPTDFYAVQVHGIMEGLLPSFVSTDREVNVIDAVSRHQHVAGMILTCRRNHHGFTVDDDDDDSAAWANAVGIPTFCVHETMSVREIAHGVLRMLRKESLEHEVESELQDGLKWLLSLMERLGHVKRQRGHHWEKLSDLEQDVLDFLGLFGKEKKGTSRSTRSHQVVCYIAWTILVFAGTYLLVRDTIARHSYRFRRALQRGSTTISPSSVIEEFCFRLPELDHGYEMVRDWLCERFAYLNEANLLHLRSNHGEPESTASIRHKRRSQKKRH